MRRHRQLGRTAAVLATALVATVLGTLLTVSPAHAMPAGTGWSGSWSYYHPNGLQYAGTLPGVKLTGYASDHSGTGMTVGTIEDTADDARCARVLVYAYHIGYIVDKSTCGVGTAEHYSTVNFHRGLLIVLYRTDPGTGDSDKGFHIFIPSSATDAQLRTVGTGASWSYYTPTSFRYQVKRPGVRLTGYGSHQAAEKRSSLNTVQKTVWSRGCASGKATGAGVSTGGYTCSKTTSKSFSRFDLQANLQASACYRPSGKTARCLPLNVPAPW